jgi:DNA-binding CsgD family transcriptional regulator
MTQPGRANSIILKTYTEIAVLLAIFILLSLNLNAQIKKTGLPLNNNFPPNTYKASTQNWSIDQNSFGFVYFANNDGLLEFDGQHWAIYPVPNRSIVRSVLVSNDTIFAGAFEEFGFYAADENGKLKYHSLLHLVPKEFHSFDEIWKIFKTKEGILFQSFKYLFLYTENSIKTYEPTSVFGHSYAIGEDIYIVDGTFGLTRIRNGKTDVLSNDPVLKNNELRCVLPWKDGKLILGLINKGLYIFDGKSLTPWDSDISRHLNENIVFSGIRLKNGLYAFGSIQNGVYIAGENGEILQHVNRYKGLLNNTVLSLFEGSNNNLWLGLDNGIDYLEIHSPLSIYDHTFHIESTYASVVHKGILYVGTNQGLFYSEIKELDNTHSLTSDFKLIPGTEGQVWKLDVIDNELLCGHNFGCFHIIGNESHRIADDRGYWNFLKHKGKTDTLICGTYNGLNILVKDKNSWRVSHKIEGFEESSKNLVQQENTLWIAHGYRGIFKVEVDNRLENAIKQELFFASNGLPAELPYNVHAIGKDIIFSTSEGFKAFDEKTAVFVPFDKYNKIFSGQSAVDNIYDDASGNLWYFTSGKMALMRLLEDGTYSNITAPFARINQFLIESYENVFVYDNRNVFIGSKNGLLHYDPFYKKDYKRLHPVVYREIVFSGGDTSLTLYNVKTNIEDNISNLSNEIRIPYRLNSVSFRFANPAFDAGGTTLFSYKMRGFDQNWSVWDQNTFKEYTNLYEGTYTFEVKAIGVNGYEEESYALTFTVQPPIYRSILAYIIYIVLLIAIVVGNVFFIQRRVALTKIEAQKRHARELQEQELGFREKALLAEKEIINLRNESLQSQVSHKNKELANTTLHLIHKNKILNAIKFQLNSLIDSNMVQSKKNQIEQLVLKINKELKNEKFQQVFDEYFDDVHQDFISRLKEQHSDLSPRELRLCAYLKMNLSTKEIAPLMNISVRGVEIGRYRLRKKLNLEREENLIDYLLRF